MNNEDIIWAAGFFDGEGCIILRKIKNSYAVRITVSQVNPAPITKLHQLFGGHISQQQSKNKKWKQQYKWEQDARSAIETLKLIRPYLICKQNVADLAFEFQLLKRKGRKLTEQDISLEQDFKKKISFLNHKD